MTISSAWLVRETNHRKQQSNLLCFVIEKYTLISIMLLRKTLKEGMKFRLSIKLNNPEKQP